jgi:hypothetical protein
MKKIIPAVVLALAVAGCSSTRVGGPTAAQKDASFISQANVIAATEGLVTDTAADLAFVRGMCARQGVEIARVSVEEAHSSLTDPRSAVVFQVTLAGLNIYCPGKSIFWTG